MREKREQRITKLGDLSKSRSKELKEDLFRITEAFEAVVPSEFIFLSGAASIAYGARYTPR